MCVGSPAAGVQARARMTWVLRRAILDNANLGPPDPNKENDFVPPSIDLRLKISTEGPDAWRATIDVFK